MSSYTFKTTNQDHEAFIGWDPMLNTFFIHVMDTAKGEDDEGYDVVWLGGNHSEVHDLDALLEEAKKHGPVSKELEDKLYRDANA
jgi:hypothetical protein